MDLKVAKTIAFGAHPSMLETFKNSAKKKSEASGYIHYSYPELPNSK